MLNSDKLWKHLLLAFAATFALYMVGFSWLEHRRHRLGPWEVTFVKEPGSAPRIQIHQDALQITNVQIEFNDISATTPTNVTVNFTAGRAVPFPVPFGECVFMDPTFLPGTVTLHLLGHEIELLPRTVRIDGRKQAWDSGVNIRVDGPP